MNFELQEEQIALMDMATRFANHEIAPYAADWDRECYFPKATLQAAANIGLAAMNCDEANGGSSLSRLDAVLVYQALARACPTISAYLSIHNMVTYAIDFYGTDAQKQHFMPNLVNMQEFSSYCLTEPDAGSDAASLTSKAEDKGDYYLLNGSKSFISGGGVSDLYMVMARAFKHGEDKGISCFLVKKDTDGLSFGGQERKMGWRAQPTAMVHFNDCKIPHEHLLGGVGNGFKIALGCLDGGRLSIAACSLGGAEYCLETTLDYVKSRKQFNQKLADFQSVQFKLADMATDLEAARYLLYRAAWLVDHESDRGKIATAAAMAKRYATDLGFDICNQALQLHGGYGYLQDFPLERFVRDLRVHQILEGTNEIMRTIIAKNLLSDAHG